MFVAVPFGLGTAIYLAEYAPRRRPQVVKPIIEVLAGIPSVVVGFFVLNLVAPDVVNQFFDQPPGAKTHARRRHRHRHPGHPDHGLGVRGRAAARCPARCARPATAAAPARSTRSSGSSSRPPSRASSRRSIIAVSRAIGETMVGDDGRPATTAAARTTARTRSNPGLSMTGGDDERRRWHRLDEGRRAVRGALPRRAPAVRRSPSCSTSSATASSSASARSTDGDDRGADHPSRRRPDGPRRRRRPR